MLAEIACKVKHIVGTLRVLETILCGGQKAPGGHLWVGGVVGVKTLICVHIRLITVVCVLIFNIAHTKFNILKCH